jgi:hypothetical protein
MRYRYGISIWDIGRQWHIDRDVDMRCGLSGDDSIDTVILDIDMGHLVNSEWRGPAEQDGVGFARGAQQHSGARHPREQGTPVYYDQTVRERVYERPGKGGECGERVRVHRWVHYDQRVRERFRVTRYHPVILSG